MRALANQVGGMEAPRDSVDQIFDSTIANLRIMIMRGGVGTEDWFGGPNGRTLVKVMNFLTRDEDCNGESLARQEAEKKLHNT